MRNYTPPRASLELRRVQNLRKAQKFKLRRASRFNAGAAAWIIVYRVPDGRPAEHTCAAPTTIGHVWQLISSHVWHLIYPQVWHLSHLVMVTQSQDALSSSTHRRLAPAEHLT